MLKIALEPFSPTIMPVPWQERVLSVRVCHSDITFDLHTTHIRQEYPISDKNWDDRGYNWLSCPESQRSITCISIRQKQSLKITFGQNIDKTGRVKTKRKFRGGSGAAWDAGERCLFESLPKHGITDSFRKLHPDDFGAYSWLYRRGEKSFTFRFDHFFASDDLQPISCAYQNNQGELSDHSPILAVYKLS